MLNLTDFNPQQKEAIETTEGPLLVLAGAGSGKTRVLTHRIAYILDTGLANPENILAVTFTNKAAGEMKQRIATILTSQQSEVRTNKYKLQVPSWVGTFHSIGVRILKLYGEQVGVGTNFSIYDSSDQTMLVKESMKDLDISTKEVNPNAVHHYISSAKNELISPLDYQSYAQGYFQQIVADVYAVYEKKLRENNAVDFDDLILLMIKLFEQNSVVLSNFQEQFLYILVDEYQDTNHAQYQLIKMLSQKHKNICAVGDDDQSIYSFRGANIKNILNFERGYPNCTIIKLEQNYRSTKTILEASYNVISKNKQRKDKKLWTNNTSGSKILVYTARDEKDEGRWVVDKIKEEQSKGVSFNDFAVLYRTNAQSRALEEAFINSATPYNIVGGVRFYERKEIKDVLAYLKLLVNGKDRTSFERVINVPRRGIGPKAVEEIYVVAKRNGINPVEVIKEGKMHDITNAKVIQFGELLTRLVNKMDSMNLIEFINYLLESTGYIKMLEDGSAENEARIENIKELITVASKFADLEIKEALELFLEEVSLLEGAVENVNQNEKVTLMTIHAAKGLEFPHVFVVGVEENLFPHANSAVDEKELEEERRLAYVAITRAKQNLYLTHAANRMYFGKPSANRASRFLEDISTDLIQVEGVVDSAFNFNHFDIEESDYHIDLKPGDRVKHEYFGQGVVKSIDDEVIIVDFGASYGLKELMIEYAKLSKN